MRTTSNDPIATIIDDTGNYPELTNGLTKREYFAALFTAASMSNSVKTYGVEDHVFTGIVAADELIKQLNK